VYQFWERFAIPLEFETLSRGPGALPAHMQVAELVARAVASGRLADGEKLAPERDMAAALGIAVGTLRKALANLTARGLVERVQGSGNYVRTRPEPQGVYGFFRLERLSGGGLPTARILNLAPLARPTDLPSLGSGDKAWRIRRLRFLDGVAAAVEEIWLDAARAGELRAETLSHSLYLHYERVLGFRIVRVEDRVCVGTVPAWSPAEFGPKRGATVGFVERVATADDGNIAEYSRNWFDPGEARYVSRMANRQGGANG